MVKSLGELGESEEIKKAASGIGRLANSLGKLKEATEGVQKMDDIRQKLEGLSDIAKAAPAIKTLSNFQTATRKTSSGVSNFAKKLVSVPWEAFKNKVSGVLKPLGNLFNSFKRIAMYRALRTALKEITQGFATGVKNLYAWAGLVGNSFVGTMDSLATSMNYLRNSLGAMVSPLLDALAPAVDVLVDKFVDLINLVNQFFATMTGATSWRKALKTQKEYADNTDDAAKAQARLNHQLMAFDELNNISVNNPSGRGGGGNNDDVSADDFEEVPLPDWAKSIKDAIDRGDWAGAGEELANKLNDVIASWDSEAAGRALGAKLQNAITAYVSFMSTMNWKGLGEKIADYLDGFIDEINPQTLGEAIVAKFNAAIGLLSGFVNNFDWSAAGTWIADVIIGAVTSIDWEDAGELVKNLAGGLLDMITAGISELWNHKSEILDAIGDFFEGLGWDGFVNVVDLVGIVAGFKMLFAAIFSDQGLISSVTGNIGTLASSLGDLTIGATILFTAMLVKGWADKVKEKGFAEGTLAYFGKGGEAEEIGYAVSVVNPDWLEDYYSYMENKYGIDRNKTGDLEILITAGVDYDANGLDLLFGGLSKSIDDLATKGQQKMAELANSDGVQNMLNFINAWLRMMGLKEIQFKVKATGLSTATTNATVLTGKTGLGGVKASYSTKVTTGGLATSTRNAQDYGKALKLVDGKTYTSQVTAKGLTVNKSNLTTYKDDLGRVNGITVSTTFKANGLSGNSEKSYAYKSDASWLSGKKIDTTFNTSGLKDSEKSSKTYKSNASWLTDKKVSTTFTSSGLSTNATYADDMRTDLKAMDGSTYNPIVSSTSLDEKANAAKKLFDNLSNSAKTWNVKVNGDIQLTDPGKKYRLEASGGFVPMGTAFIAGEAGPELVGTINGRTGVVSANEISGIGDAIYDTGETEAALLQQLLIVGQQLLAKSGNVTLAPNAAAGRWVAQSQAAYARATGG